jgi:manganese transport protein
MHFKVRGSAVRENSPDPVVPRNAVRASRRLLLGSTFIAAVAYIDPGNFATNTLAGSRFGYLLVWVVVAANIVAMLIQFLTAKLGIASGRSLPALCRERFSPIMNKLLWVQAELVCIATDIAEIVGGALALYLLFGLPHLVGGVITAAVSLAILLLQPGHRRSFESVVCALFAIVMMAFVYQITVVGIDPSAMVEGLVPRLSEPGMALVAAGIIGATVMPHVIYLHSAMTAEFVQDRPSLATRIAMVRGQRTDIVIALGLAGVVNLLILTVAAQTFYGGVGKVDTIERAYEFLGTLVGPLAAIAFGLALLASGVASSCVGTYAGEAVMAGFLGTRIPRVVRRLITVLPAILLLALGVNASMALVLSQVVLSFGIPFAVVPLLWFTSRHDVMGRFVNGRMVAFAGALAAGLIIILNVNLIKEAVLAILA